MASSACVPVYALLWSDDKGAPMIAAVEEVSDASLHCYGGDPDDNGEPYADMDDIDGEEGKDQRHEEPFEDEDEDG